MDVITTCRGAGALLMIGLAAGCGPGESTGSGAAPEGEADAVAREIDATLSAALAAARAGADSVVDALRPVALLTPGGEASLRRYRQAQHLARARALGARPADAAERERFVEEGRLVRVPDSTTLYAVRGADRSSALLTPDALALLEEIATRFQAELRDRGLPPYRLVVTSMLRTAEEQAALRRVNPNAAAGTSTHEFGTTMDITYESYRAPPNLPRAYAPAEPAWLTPHAAAAATAMLEYAAARKSRELQAILGDVLRAMQAEGKVLVTLERQQPVYHLTVARRMTGA